MPHIHTNPGEHDQTVSLYLFRTDFPEPKIMLHFHRKLNAYMQFGGHIELLETPMQALIHELREESGYTTDQIYLLQPHARLKNVTGAITHPMPVTYNTHPVGTDHFHSDIVYAAIANEDPQNSPEEGESTDILLLTQQELKNLPADKIIESVREIALFIFDTILDDWEAISPHEFES